MHEGRIKPLDTVAREEVKQIYGRETIKLHDPAEEIEKILDPAAARESRHRGPVAELGPGGCVPRLDRSSPSSGTTSRSSWSTICRCGAGSWPRRSRSGSKAIAEKSTTPEDEKPLLQKLASESEPAYAALANLARTSKLPIEDQKTIAELAAKLTEEHKWMTPRELDESRVSRGRRNAFLPRLGLASCRR